mgnify:CR=1 FL=1
MKKYLILLLLCPWLAFAATTTTNLGLKKPTPGGDTDVWGEHLNDNADVLEAWVMLWDAQATIATPDNLTYPRILYSPFAGTVTAVRAKCDSGTATVTGKLNAVALGGTANSVTSTTSSQAHSSSNTFTVGQPQTFTVSSNASCTNLQVQFHGVRTSDD